MWIYIILWVWPQVLRNENLKLFCIFVIWAPKYHFPARLIVVTLDSNSGAVGYVCSGETEAQHSARTTRSFFEWPLEQIDTDISVITRVGVGISNKPTQRRLSETDSPDVDRCPTVTVCYFLLSRFTTSFLWVTTVKYALMIWWMKIFSW